MMTIGSRVISGINNPNILGCLELYNTMQQQVYGSFTVTVSEYSPDVRGICHVLLFGHTSWLPK